MTTKSKLAVVPGQWWGAQGGRPWTEPADLEHCKALCRAMPREFRWRWAESVVDIASDDLGQWVRVEGSAHGSFAAAKARRASIHIIRDVCGLTIPELAPLVGMSVFSTAKAANVHRRRHEWCPGSLLRPFAEAVACDDWAESIAYAMWDSFDEDMALLLEGEQK